MGLYGTLASDSSELKSIISGLRQRMGSLSRELEMTSGLLGTIEEAILIDEERHRRELEAPRAAAERERAAAMDARDETERHRRVLEDYRALEARAISAEQHLAQLQALLGAAPKKESHQERDRADRAAYARRERFESLGVPQRTDGTTPHTASSDFIEGGPQ